MKIAHALNLNSVVRRIVPNLGYSVTETVGQNVAKSLSHGDLTYQLKYGFFVAPVQLQASSHLVVDNSLFIEFHCPRDEPPCFKRVYAIHVDQMIRHQNCFHLLAVDHRAKGP